MRTAIESNSKKYSFTGRKRRTRRKNIIFYLILTLVGVIMFLPTFMMVISSLKTYDEYYEIPFHFFPRVLAFDNYARIFRSPGSDIINWVGNTLFLLISNTVICTFSTILVAYGFAKFRSKLSDALFMVLLCTMMIPWAVTMVPSYIVWAKLGLVDTPWPLILPSIGGSAFYTFMFKQTMRGIPNEIMEAAEMDGANSFARLWLIVVPNCVPAIVIMVLFTAMGQWGDYLGPLIYLRTPEKYNISLGLNLMRSRASSGGRVDSTMLLAASVLMAIPSIAMYFGGTKIFAKGISLQGGVKG